MNGEALVPLAAAVGFVLGLLAIQRHRSRLLADKKPLCPSINPKENP